MEDGNGTGSASSYNEFSSSVTLLVVGTIRFMVFTSAVLLSGCAAKAHKRVLDNSLVLQENLRSSVFEQVLTLSLNNLLTSKCNRSYTVVLSRIPPCTLGGTSHK